MHLYAVHPTLYIYISRVFNILLCIEMNRSGGLPLVLLVLVLVLCPRFSRAEDKKKWSVDGFLKNCSPNWTSEPQESKDFVEILRRCVQRRALVAMDALLADDVIPVVEGIELVRFVKNSNESTESKANDNAGSTEGRESGKSWGAVVFSRLARIFRTHVLKIDVDRLTSGVGASNDTKVSDESGDNSVQGRRRRHRRRHHTMPMLMMGVLIMGSVLVPMGFQFLAVLGGKALILAKLALMLSSIQGLKKIATNGVNYGLYHASEPWHERSGNAEPSAARFEIPYQIYPTRSTP